MRGWDKGWYSSFKLLCCVDAEILSGLRIGWAGAGLRIGDGGFAAGFVGDGRWD